MGWVAYKKRCLHLEKQNQSLLKQIQGHKEQIDQLQEQNQQLKAKLARSQKTSRNSSKPPSSDIVKPKPRGRKRRKNKRKIGAQPGHPKHQRPPFDEGQIRSTFEYHLKKCPCCQGPVQRDWQAAPRIQQQIELPDQLFYIDQYSAYGYGCAHCRKTYFAKIPRDILQGGLCGPRLTSMVALMKGALSLSYSSIQSYLEQVLELPLSRGYLAKLIQKTTGSLQIPYQGLLESLPGQSRINVDETGHKDNGLPWWTWVFRGKDFALFKIQESRSSQVLKEVLGEEFKGVLGCDYFSAYRKYMGDCDVLVQFCLAHLIRDLRFLSEHDDLLVSQYGECLLKKLRSLFRLIHDRKDSKVSLEKDLKKIQKQFIRLATRTEFLSPIAWYRREKPGFRLVENMADRFRKHGEAYFQFITTPGMEPTNNLAEQAIRFIVIGRRVTQGTRGQKGREFCQRIWTTWATCKIQGRSTYQFLVDCYQAWLHRSQPPELLPSKNF